MSVRESNETFRLFIRELFIYTFTLTSFRSPTCPSPICQYLRPITQTCAHTSIVRKTRHFLNTIKKSNLFYENYMWCVKHFFVCSHRTREWAAALKLQQANHLTSSVLQLWYLSRCKNRVILAVKRVKVKWSFTGPVWPRSWVEVYLYSFLTTALEGGEWSAARPGRTLPPGKTRYPFYRRLGGLQGRYGRMENLFPTGTQSRTVQPGVSHYTDWATRPTLLVVRSCKMVALRVLMALRWRKLRKLKNLSVRIFPLFFYFCFSP